MKSIRFTLALSFLLLFKLYGQDSSSMVFDDSEVAVVKIYIEQEYLDYLYVPENFYSDSLFPARFTYQNAQIPDTTVENIGFRIRGNTSRESRKKSFKVDFNHFVKGRQFYDLEKMNLNGEHNDPSIVRAKLCWDMFNQIGVPASRANHARVYINDEYYGLYINVEHIDDEFVQKRFGSQDGNLYKCLYPADLVYEGPEQYHYKVYHGDRRAYELKTNQETDDYSDLVHFIDVLNNTPDSRFKTEIEKIFNVDNFLKCLAMDVLTGSWDDYWYLKNNYYLYHVPASDRFEFIPYDYDNTYGIDWVGGDWGTRDIYNWGHQTEPRPLVERILNVTEYRNQYTQILSDLMENEFSFANQEPHIDQLKAMITPAAEEDHYRTLDWEFSIDDFHNSYNEQIFTTEHVDYGLKPYIQKRINTATAQLNYIPASNPPAIGNVRILPRYPAPNEDVIVQAEVTSETLLSYVRVYARIPTQTYTLITMLDDGAHNDGEAQDGIYAAAINGLPDGTIIYYYIEAMNTKQAMTTTPATAPENAFFYRIHQPQQSDVEIRLHLQKSLGTADVGIGVLGSFNTWNIIYPMQQSQDNLWETSLYLSPGDHLYKFVTYNQLNGQEGVTEWLSDPRNPMTDGEPYFNSKLSITDPMIYYVTPMDGDTLTTNSPHVTAQFASSRDYQIDPNSIELYVDDVQILNAGEFYNANSKSFDFQSTDPLSPGDHELLLVVQNSNGDRAESRSHFTVLSLPLVINEFLASNDASFADPNGDYDDWVEIYNNGSEPISMKGMYLTDDFSNPRRWMFPDTTIQPGGFLLVWTDDDENQGALHTDFKLDADGEQVGLFSDDATGNVPIDTLSFVDQKTDTSFGRIPDGSATWLFLKPTPGMANTTLTNVAANLHEQPSDFQLKQNYPNPFNPGTTISFDLKRSTHVVLEVYNLAGQEIMTLINEKMESGRHSIIWNGMNQYSKPVTSGIYFYKLQVGEQVEVRKMALVH